MGIICMFFVNAGKLLQIKILEIRFFITLFTIICKAINDCTKQKIQCQQLNSFFKKLNCLFKKFINIPIYVIDFFLKWS